MSPAPAPIVGSLGFLMDQLVIAQAEVAASPYLASMEPLTLYRWRDEVADGPALYNQLGNPGTYTQKDTARGEDSFYIETRLGVHPKDSDERHADMEALCDAYRFVIDPIFRREVAGRGELLGGSARWAARVSFAWFSDNFGGMTLVGPAFVQRFDVPRIVLPAP